MKPDKLLQAMRANPKGDWTIADVEALCKSVANMVCSPPSSGGSHYKVRHPSVRMIQTIPFNRPIKPVYIRQLVRFVDGVRAIQRSQAKD